MTSLNAFQAVNTGPLKAEFSVEMRGGLQNQVRHNTSQAAVAPLLRDDQVVDTKPSDTGRVGRVSVRPVAHEASPVAALAFFLGIMAATRRDSFWDQGVKFLAVLGQALPGFWVAIMAILVFAVYWGVLPVPNPTKQSLAHYVMPVGTMVFFMLPGMMRLVRSSMLDVLDSEYIKLARIKGLPERIVIWKHALRNALITPLTTLGMLIPSLVLGAVVAEIIFTWPGMGKMILESTFQKDFAVVQAITILTAVLVLTVNLLVDISYAYVDPRIRYQRT